MSVITHLPHRPSELVRMWPTGSFADRLTTDDFHALRAIGRQVHYATDVQFMTQGRQDDSTVFFDSGLAKVVITDALGHHQLLDVRGPGELFGATACISRAPRWASAITLGSTLALRIPGPAFRTLLLSRPALALALTCSVGARLRAAHRQRIELSSQEVAPRLVAAILDLAPMFEPHQRRTLEIPLSQDELAQLINAAQVSVQRALRSLRLRRLVHTGYRKVRIPCLPCLAASTSGTATGCGGLDHRHRSGIEKHRPPARS